MNVRKGLLVLLFVPLLAGPASAEQELDHTYAYGTLYCGSGDGTVGATTPSVFEGVSSYNHAIPYLFWYRPGVGWTGPYWGRWMHKYGTQSQWHLWPRVDQPIAVQSWTVPRGYWYAVGVWIFDQNRPGHREVGYTTTGLLAPNGIVYCYES
jgi:hypothetical protein